MDRAGTPGSRAATPGSRAATPGSGGRVDFAEGSGGTLADQWSTPMKARGSSPYKVPQSGGMDFEPPTSDFSGRGTSRDGSLRRRSAQPEKDPDAVFGSQRSRAAELGVGPGRGAAPSCVDAACWRRGALKSCLKGPVGDRAGLLTALAADGWRAVGRRPASGREIGLPRLVVSCIIIIIDAS